MAAAGRIFRTLVTALVSAAALAACAKTSPPPTAANRAAAGVRAKAAMPEGFMWGVSTAGFQWEGQDTTSQWAAWDKAGKTSERNPRGADGLVRYEEDADLTRGLGCNAFRTSIEWARIEPQEGVIDQAAVQHYHNVLDALRARGIEPLVTLHHFAYPAWMDKDGGWEGNKAPERFARFAAFVAKEYGAKVKWYITFNEPNVFLMGGWLSPMMPPGKTDPLAGLRALRRIAKAHALAYDALHAHDTDAQVSFNMYTAEWALGGPTRPATPMDAADPRKEAEREICSDTFLFDEVEKHGRKLDYAALDYYCKFKLYLPFVFPRADTWEVYPEGLYKAVKRYHKRYKLPVLIAENGIATWDLAPRKDRWTRSASLVAHVRQLQRAMDEGVPVLGYVHWSITDNYEWGTFSPRFGLFSVDCRNGNFTRKEADGAEAFRRVIAARGATDDLVRRYPPPAAPALPTPWVNGGTGTPVQAY